MVMFGFAQHRLVLRFRGLRRLCRRRMRSRIRLASVRMVAMSRSCDRMNVWSPAGPHGCSGLGRAASIAQAHPGPHAAHQRPHGAEVRTHEVSCSAASYRRSSKSADSGMMQVHIAAQWSLQSAHGGPTPRLVRRQPLGDAQPGAQKTHVLGAPAQHVFSGLLAPSSSSAHLPHA